jgi:hypothetical protein
VCEAVEATNSCEGERERRRERRREGGREGFREIFESFLILTMAVAGAYVNNRLQHIYVLKKFLGLSTLYAKVVSLRFKL